MKLAGNTKIPTVYGLKYKGCICVDDEECAYVLTRKFSRWNLQGEKLYGYRLSVHWLLREHGTGSSKVRDSMSFPITEIPNPHLSDFNNSPEVLELENYIKGYLEGLYDQKSRRQIREDLLEGVISDIVETIRADSFFLV